MVATSIYWVVVPMASEMMFQRQPISGNFSDRSNELIDDVHKLDRLRKAATDAAL